ncbi:condensation domain-containing protein [Lachnotalea glycerini]|uniref:Carrier domain-containing protein n=1 Tax=Lachnotalea glycerini TaxID=1763509 RepID=A0A371JK11_9FIRM|nr:condensation domain-containing protein [Lachnotalea glycerini]RDY33066.1 hypothetical protein CG710_000630 [Lachnotalea glycerini]
MINKNTILDLMYQSIQGKNESITFIKESNIEKKVLYKELYSKSKLVLKHLQDRGLKKGDEVIIRLSDNEKFLYTFWACLLGGIIPVPFDYLATSANFNKLIKIYNQIPKSFMVTEEDILKELHHISDDEAEENLKDIETKVIYFQDINSDNGYGNLEDIVETDIAFIQYSSGSTGNPKGVVITHENLMSNIESIIIGSKHTVEDKYISWMPLHHDLGLTWFCLMPMVLNVKQYNIATSLFLKDPLLWLEKTSEKGATILVSPNFGYKYLLEKYEDSKNYGWDLSRVRLIINGAEPISVDIVNEFIKKMKKYNLNQNTMYTVYGLAESTLIVSLAIPGEPFQSIKIDRNYLSVGDKIVRTKHRENGIELAIEGIKVRDVDFRITDLKHKELPDEHIGQIEIRGKSVTKGYYKEKASDRKTYMSDDGWLNTGDLGFVTNNYLVVAARQKEIVIINGQNYYLYDIEQVLEKLDEIPIEGVIASVVSSANNEDLLIIFVKHESIDDKFINKYRAIVSTLNKEFGIQAYSILPIKNIPKTTSGKLQRYKAAEIYKQLSQSEKNNMESTIKQVLKSVNTEYRKNAYKILEQSEYKLNSVEKKVIEITSSVLKYNEINIFDNFFELGVNSILMKQIGEDLREVYGEKILTSAIYKNPTIKELSDYIIEHVDTPNIKLEKKNKKNNNYYKIKMDDYYKLSEEQERQYVLNCLDHKSTNYNISVVWILDGKLDLKQLNYAFMKLVERHESLRTSFHLVKGTPKQKIHKNLNIRLEENKLKKDEDLEEVISKSIKPFDLTMAPLIRIKIINFEKDKNVMILDMHHIIGDGASLEILVKELESLYCGRNLSKVDFQYKDYVMYQYEFMKSVMYLKEKEFWNSMYEKKPFERELITDYKRYHTLDNSGKRIYKSMNKELSEKIKGIGRSNNCTLFMVLLAAFSITLSNYYYEDDISIGTPIIGRPNKNFYEVIGLFVNTLAIRLHLNKSITFEEYLSYVKNICIDAFSNEEYQYNELVNHLNVTRKTNKNPIFDVFFALQNAGTSDLNLNQILAKKYSCKNNSARFDISIDIYEKEELSCVLEYRTSLFKEETILEMFSDFENVFIQVANNSKIKINTIKCIQKRQNDNKKNSMDFSFNF